MTSGLAGGRPLQPVPAGDEREGILGFLHQQQEAVLNAVAGLDDDQARRRHAPSTLTLIGIVNHLTQVQREWRERILASPRPSLGEHDDLSFDTGERTLADVVASFEAESAACLDCLGSADLDALIPVPSLPWNAGGPTHWQVRSAGFQLIQELARHAGHMDLIREAIDGRVAFELPYVRRGEPYPAWLRASLGRDR